MSSRQSVINYSSNHLLNQRQPSTTNTPNYPPLSKTQNYEGGDYDFQAAPGYQRFENSSNQVNQPMGSSQKRERSRSGGKSAITMAQKINNDSGKYKGTNSGVTGQESDVVG